MRRNLYILIASLFFLFSCTEEIDKSNRYVFTGETLGSYLKHRAEEYGNMLYLVERADMMGLLESYGRYTFFVPTDDGIEKFFIEQDSIYHATKDAPRPIWTGITSPHLEDVTDSMATVIVRIHLIERDYETADMGEGEHHLRMKQIYDFFSSFYFDYIEIVPLSIISDPIKPEDRG